jgi:hypothetical protein
MMAPYLILAIVEGHGEQKAVPLLLRRWFKHRRFRNFETRDLAIRAAGAGALKCPYDPIQGTGIEYYIELAASEQPDGILVMLDADDECLERAKDRRRLGLGPELLQRARRVAPHVPIEVVVANREFEVWFLAALDTLRRVGALPREKRWEKSIADIESIRDCKKPLAYMLGRPYEETTDQTDFTGALPFTATMARRSRSYRKLMDALQALTQAARGSRRRHTSASPTGARPTW